MRFAWDGGQWGTELTDLAQRCDDQNKRLANQTFFGRIYLDEGGTLTAGTVAPFATILDETSKQQAIT